MTDDADAFADAPELDGGTWSAPVSAAKPKRRAIDTSLRHTYKTIRDNYKRQCAAAGLPCAICHRRIDYTLPHRHPSGGAFELDHIESVELHPELALVVSNFQPSHALCNKRRGMVQGIEDYVGNSGGMRDEGDDATAVKVFITADGRRIEYEYSTSLYSGSNGPSEPW